MGRGNKTQKDKAKADKEVVETTKAPPVDVDNGGLKDGDTVRLNGLQGAAHLNGLTGVCQSFDASTGRWTIMLHATGEQKSLKPVNLTFEEPSIVAPKQDKDSGNDEADDQSPEDVFGRMATDLESGFVGCPTLAAARQAIDDKEKRIEFSGIASPTELAECLELVEGLLTGAGSEDRPLRGLSFASCNLTSDDLRRLTTFLKHDAGQKMGAFGVSKNPGIDREAWHELFAHLPAKAVWFDFGDNKLVDADVAPLIGSLVGRDDLDKLYLDGNKLREMSMLCKALPDTGITNLDIGDNQVGDMEVEMLGTVLSRSVVMILVLGSNPISADGVTAVFEALPRSSIDALYLDHTGADDSCLVALASVLKDSKLTELHLDATKISDAGVRNLIPHIGASELSYIDVADNNVSEETVKLLEETASQARADLDEGDEDAEEEEDKSTVAPQSKGSGKTSSGKAEPKSKGGKRQGYSGTERKGPSLGLDMD